MWWWRPALPFRWTMKRLSGENVWPVAWCLKWKGCMSTAKKAWVYAGSTHGSLTGGCVSRQWFLVRNARWVDIGGERLEILAVDVKFKALFREILTRSLAASTPFYSLILLVGGLEHVYFPIYWEWSSQLTNIFQRGRSTTNQYTRDDPFLRVGRCLWYHLRGDRSLFSQSLGTVRFLYREIMIPFKRPLK